MVRSIHKINIIFIITLLIGAVAILQNSSSVEAEDVDFNVNVTEALTVSISTPTSWASGNAGDNLLRNKVTVSALTNNNNGVTVSMYADDTNLHNTTSYSSTDATTYIPTLDANTYTTSTFPSNAWGYSLTDNVAGTDASYLPMTDDAAAPITVLESALGSQGSKDVFFGAKASTAKQAGTYAQTVYFTAVTGTIDSSTNPPDPTSPSGPTDTDSTPAYDSTTGNPADGTGQTTYTRRTTSGSGASSVSGTADTTTTQVTRGDTRNSYARAAGVTSTTPSTTSSDNISTLGIALASAAGVAAVSGIVFLVVAKRRKDDD